MKDHRKYIRWFVQSSLDREWRWLTLYSLYVYNKIDSISVEFLDKLAHEPHTAVMSCELDLGVQDVIERIWKELRLMRIYTKRLATPNPLFLSCVFANYSIEKELTLISARHLSSAVTRLSRMCVIRSIVHSKIRSSMRLYGVRVRDMFRSVSGWDTKCVMRT